MRPSKKSFDHLTAPFVFSIFKNYLKYSKGYGYTIPVNFKINPPCQTLSKLFDMSKNTPLASWSLWKYWYISWMMNRCRFMKESLEQKPYSLGDSMPFPLRDLYNSLKKSLLKILLKINSKKTGRSFLMHSSSIVCVCQL